MPDLPATDPAGPFRDRRILALSYGLTAAFCVAVAIVLTALTERDFGHNLVYSLLIGACAATGCIALQHLPLLARWSRARGLFAGFLVSTPVAYLVGSMLARALLGERPLWPSGLEDNAIPIGATLISATVVTWWVWLYARIAEEGHGRARAQRLASEAELRLLRAQLEPHMLFNTLANLRSLIDEDPREAQRMLDQLIVFLRSTLAGSRQSATTLEEDFAQLRAYLSLMAMRLGPRLRWSLDLPAALHRETVPPMLLQPLVENAIRHGIEPKRGGGEIVVEARRDGGAIALEVRDTGIGPGAEREEGYGLAHVRERLTALHGEAATLALAPLAGGGTRVTVRWPSQAPAAAPAGDATIEAAR